MGRRPGENRTVRHSRVRAGAWCAAALVGAIATAPAAAAPDVVAANPQNVKMTPAAAPDARAPEIYGPIAPVESTTQSDAPQENSNASAPLIERQPIGPARATDQPGARTDHMGGGAGRGARLSGGQPQIPPKS